MAAARKKPTKKKWIQAGKKKGTIREGGFHASMGKSKDEKITAADIAKGKRSSNPKVRKQAVLAENFRKMRHKKKK
jgi:hypothetical protein